MMPVTRATLSFVPKSSTASSFNEAAKRSTNSLPTAVTSDVGESRIAVASSPAARATPRGHRAAHGSRDAVERRGDGHGPHARGRDLTAFRRGDQQSRNSPGPDRPHWRPVVRSAG